MAYKFVDSGAGGNNDGTTWTHAWTSIVSANGVAADTIVLVKGGTSYDAQDGATNSCLNVAANGTISQPVIFQGDDASGGAGEGAPATFTLNAATNTLAYGAITPPYTVWKYVIFTGSSSHGLYSTTADNVICYECTFHTAGNYGAQGDDSWTMIGCVFHGNTNGFDGDYNNWLIGCQFYNNSGADILNVYDGSVVIYCAFPEDNNVTCLTHSGTGNVVFIGNTFDGMTDGLAINCSGGAISKWPIIMNNCIYDMATGLQAGTAIAGGFTAIRNNLFNSNTADVNANANILVGEDTQTGAPNFVTEGTDYHPDTGSPLIDNALDAGDIGV